MLGLDQDLIVGYRGVPGNVLQVVNATYSTTVTNNTSTLADTGLTATITPSSASSKILVLVNQAGCYKSTNNTYMGLQLFRGATLLTRFEVAGGYTNSTASNNFGSCSTCYLDSPSSTSSLTYKTQFFSQTNNVLVQVQQSDGANSATSTITLMEIAA